MGNFPVQQNFIANSHSLAASPQKERIRFSPSSGIVKFMGTRNKTYMLARLI